MSKDLQNEEFPDEIPNAFSYEMNLLQFQEESFWSSLSKEEQLSAFNCVIRRLHRGEIEEERSYRGILYDLFEFGYESYIRAQSAGFISIHNSIMNRNQQAEQLKRFAKSLGIENEKIEESVNRFLRGNRI
jgi:exonuclease VII small subunit